MNPKYPDKILAIVLKSYAAEIATPLVKLFQCSHNTGIYPTMSKFAQGCLVHTKQNNSNLATCCPISLLSIISKVMEGAIKQHLLRNNLLSDTQFGFRQGHSAPDLI
eukprot:g11648.t1